MLKISKNKKIFAAMVALVVLSAVLVVYFVFIQNDKWILRTERIVQAAAVQGEHIYFMHVGHPFLHDDSRRYRQIEVKRTTFDGETSSVFSFQFEVGRGEIEIPGFFVTDDGYFRFLFLETDGHWRTPYYRIHYVTYDAAGQLVFQHELTDFMMMDLLNSHNSIRRGVFTPEGDVVFIAFSDGGVSVSIVNQAGEIRSEWAGGGQLVQLRDGRIALASGSTLYEIDVAAGELSETIVHFDESVLPQFNRFGIVPPWAQFDLYMSDIFTNHIYGYDLATETLTPLIDLTWMEEEFGSLHINVWNSSHQLGGIFCILPDGRIALFFRSHGYTNLIILTPDLSD